MIGTRTRTGLALPAHASIVTGQVALQSVAEVFLLPIPIRQVVARLALEAALHHSAAGRAVLDETMTVGGQGRGHRLAEHTLPDGTIIGMIGVVPHGEMDTILTHVRRGSETGLHLQESGTPLRHEAVACDHHCALADTTSHAPVLIGEFLGSPFYPQMANLRSPPRRYSPARDSRDYRRRSLSPRRERVDPYVADTWRRRSPSQTRQAYASNDASGRESAATSRRSSPPPVHPSRTTMVEDRTMRDPASAPRSPYRERDDRDRDREYERDRDYGRDRERERSPPRHRDTPPTGPRGDREFAPPLGPSSSYRNGESGFARAPPTGPSGRGYPSPAISPPAGPSSSTPQPPTYPRGSNPVLAAPTRPSGRGRGGFGYDAPRDFSGPPPRRGSAHWGGRGGGGYYGGPPSGPRGPVSGPAPFTPAFRGSSNSTSTTYPRTQRFRDHLADLPKEVPGGQKAPEIYDKSKILKLEDEARKLRDLIDAKESAKRQRLKEWDTLEKDANNAALRADLAEQQLRSLSGEGDIGGAAF